MKDRQEKKKNKTEENKNKRKKNTRCTVEKGMPEVDARFSNSPRNDSEDSMLLIDANGVRNSQRSRASARRMSARVHAREYNRSRCTAIQSDWQICDRTKQ